LARLEIYTKESAQLRSDFALLRQTASLLPPLQPVPIVDEGVGQYLAYRVLHRLALFAQLRDGMARGIEAVQATLHAMHAAHRGAPPATTLAGMQTKMPEWWFPPVHDWALLRGVFKHGLGSVDAMLSDPAFAEAWRPNLGESYTFISWCHPIVSQSSGAKVVLRKNMESYLPNFLADRAPLNKRLGLLANWMLFGGPNHPNPAAPVEVLSVPTGATANAVAASAAAAAAAGGAADAGAAATAAAIAAVPPPSPLSQFVSSTGKALDSSRARPIRLPLVAILDAKLTGRLPSSSDDVDTYDEPAHEDAGMSAAAPAAAVVEKPAAVPRKKAPARPIAAVHEPVVDADAQKEAVAAPASGSGKRRRSSSKRAQEAAEDAEVEEEVEVKRPTPRKRKAEPAASAATTTDAAAAIDGAESGAIATPPAPKKQAVHRSKASAAGKPPAAPQADAGTGDVSMNPADQSSAAIAAVAAAAAATPGPPAPKPKRTPPLRRGAGNLASESEVYPAHVKVIEEVRRDAQGRPLPFGVKGGIHILSLGQADPRPNFRKGTCMFPPGFVSSRPYHSVVNPAHKTVWTSRVLLDESKGPSSSEAAAPYFTVTAADDPSTVWSGTSAATCWTAISVAAHQARGGGSDTKTGAVNGLEYFGLSNPVVKALFAEQMGTNAPQELVTYVQQHRAMMAGTGGGGAAAGAASHARPGVAGGAAAHASTSPAQVAAAQAAAVAAQAAAAAAASPMHVEGQTAEQQSAAHLAQQKRAVAAAAVAAAAAAAAADPVSHYPGGGTALHASTLGFGAAASGVRGAGVGGVQARPSLGALYPTPHPYLSMSPALFAGAQTAGAAGSASSAPATGATAAAQAALAPMTPATYDQMLQFYAFLSHQQQLQTQMHQQQQQMALQAQNAAGAAPSATTAAAAPAAAPAAAFGSAPSSAP
jgi:hypothetical protein